MKRIELTQEKFAKVDDVVYEWLHYYNWYPLRGKTGTYARRSVKVELDGLERHILLHRMIAGITGSQQIRFENGNSLDCCMQNLRIVDKEGNVIEWEGSCGASHFNGVKWDGWYGLWRAEFDEMIIGYTIGEIEAAQKYNEKARKFAPETVNDLKFLWLEK